MSDWYDNEALWQDIAAVPFTDKRLRLAGPEVDRILGLVELPTGAAFVDFRV